MAVLRHVVTAAVVAVAASGCSLLLDADELRADDALVSDTGVGDTPAGDTTPADTTPGDSGPGDTSPGDTGPVDTGPGDTTPIDTTPADTTPAVDVQVAFPGAGNACSVRYDVPVLGMCLETCPAGGWTFIFDGSGSTGVDSFSWKFTASTGYTVDPATATGARATVKVDFDGGGPVPLCGNTNPDIDPGKLTVELGVNGEARESVGSLDFFPTKSGECASSGDCPNP